MINLATYREALPLPFTAIAPGGAPPRTRTPHDARTCARHALFCARNGFYRVALVHALRALVRPL